jgi:hypothetical protein
MSNAINEVKAYTEPMRAALAGFIGRPPTVEMAQAIVELDERLTAIEGMLEGCIELDHRGEPCGLKARQA